MPAPARVAPEYLTANEAAAVLRVGPRVIYSLVAAGELNAVRLGTGPQPRLRIPSHALEDLERSRRTTDRGEGDRS